jgi:putative transposase
MENKKHHRRSIRLKGYDYSLTGVYFVTICSQNRDCLFGDIQNGKMVLNNTGRIVFDEWMKTPLLRPNVELDEFVVMPNHVHGIIMITESHRRGVSQYATDKFVQTPGGVSQYPPDKFVQTPGGVSQYAPDKFVQTPGGVSQYPPDKFVQTPGGVSQYAPTNTAPLRSPSQTLGAIIRGYKSAVKTRINNRQIIPISKIWQRNYWEHIIRNESEMLRIREYIRKNPKKWNVDSLYMPSISVPGNL